MATFPFVQPPSSPFTFQPTLDGAQYTGVVTWSLFGRRYYLDLYQLNGARVFTQPVAESPAGLDMQSLSWANGWVTTTTVKPHGYALRSTVDVTVADCVPAAYNGRVLALVSGPNEIKWQLAGDPGQATTLGHVIYTIDMASGYFNTSSLAYRNGQFEVTP